MPKHASQVAVVKHHTHQTYACLETPTIHLELLAIPTDNKSHADSSYAKDPSKQAVK